MPSNQTNYFSRYYLPIEGHSPETVVKCEMEQLGKKEVGHMVKISSHFIFISVKPSAYYNSRMSLFK